MPRRDTAYLLLSLPKGTQCVPYERVRYETVKESRIFLFETYMLLYTNIKYTIYCG